MKKKDFDVIASILANDKHASVDELVMFANEEVGEVSHAILVERGLKKNDLKEPSKAECVDVIIDFIALFQRLGGTHKDFKEVFKRKTDKWATRIKTLSTSAKL